MAIKVASGIKAVWEEGAGYSETENQTAQERKKQTDQKERKKQTRNSQNQSPNWPIIEFILHCCQGCFWDESGERRWCRLTEKQIIKQGWCMSVEWFTWNVCEARSRAIEIGLQEVSNGIVGHINCAVRQRLNHELQKTKEKQEQE